MVSYGKTHVYNNLLRLVLQICYTVITNYGKGSFTVMFISVRSFNGSKK